MDRMLLTKAWARADRGEIHTCHVWHRKNFLFSQMSPSDWIYCRISYELTPDEEAEGCFIEGDPGLDLFVSREGFAAIKTGTARKRRPIVSIVDDYELEDFSGLVDRCLEVIAHHDYSTIFVPEVTVYI